MLVAEVGAVAAARRVYTDVLDRDELCRPADFLVMVACKATRNVAMPETLGCRRMARWGSDCRPS